MNCCRYIIKDWSGRKIELPWSAPTLVTKVKALQGSYIQGEGIYRGNRGSYLPDVLV